MKRKVLACLLTFSMVMTGGCILASAEAETETEVTSEAAADTDQLLELSFDNIDESVYEGDWFSFEPGFDLYLPVDWEDVLTEDDEKADIICHIAAPDDSGRNIVISQTDASKIGDGVELDGIVKELETINATSITYANINGIGAVGFDLEDKKVSGIAFLGENGDMYTIQAAPMTDGDDEMNAIVLNVFSSLSESEDGEAAEDADAAEEAETETETESAE